MLFTRIPQVSAPEWKTWVDENDAVILTDGKQPGLPCGEARLSRVARLVGAAPTVSFRHSAHDALLGTSMQCIGIGFHEL